MTEEWRPVPGFPGYMVSDQGRVRSIDACIWYGSAVGFGIRKGRILKNVIDGNGYSSVTLTDTAGKRRTVPVHLAVAQSFFGPYPVGQQVRHLDGNRANPTLINLAYGTPKENHADSYRHGTRNPEKDLTTGQKTRKTKDQRYGRKFWTDGWRNGISYSKVFDL